VSVYNEIVERFVLRASDAVLKRTIKKDFAFLQKSKLWSRADLEAFQDQKLQKLIVHAYENVPYYRMLFDERNLKPADIQTRVDLKKLPLLTKEIIKKNYNKLIASNVHTMRTIAHKSSGSTGEPMQYLVTNEAYSFNIACNMRGWYWMGYRFGDPFVKISQYQRNKGKQIQDVFLRTLYVPASPLTDERFGEIVAQLRKFKPQIIRSYPDPLFFLAQYMEKYSINDIKPTALTTTGSMLLPAMRQKIEAAFGTRIFDSYRCEGGPNAFETPDHHAYMLSMEYGISEILAQGDDVGPGEKGRHVTTDLHNYAMPFIRYDSQDIVQKMDSRYSGQSAHEHISKVFGRQSDIVRTSNGQYLIVLHFADYFDAFCCIKQFQVVQQGNKKYIFKLVVTEQFDEKTKEQIKTYWEKFIGDNPDIEIKLVESIKPAPSGKHRFVLRDESIPLGM